MSETLFATNVFNALGCVLIQFSVIVESDQKCISFKMMGNIDMIALYNFANNKAAHNSNFGIVSLDFKGATLDFEQIN